MTKEMIEEMVIVGGLVMVQFVYAGNSLLMSYLMSLGLGPFTIVIFSTFATFVILSPFAILFERSGNFFKSSRKRPNNSFLLVSDSKCFGFCLVVVLKEAMAK